MGSNVFAPRRSPASAALESIVRAHLRRAVEELSAEESDVAADVFRFLVTPSGAKIAHGVRTSPTTRPSTSSDSLPVLSTLGRERIVRHSRRCGGRCRRPVRDLPRRARRGRARLAPRAGAGARTAGSRAAASATGPRRALRAGCPCRYDCRRDLRLRASGARPGKRRARPRLVSSSPVPRTCSTRIRSTASPSLRGPLDWSRTQAPKRPCEPLCSRQGFEESCEPAPVP